MSQDLISVLLPRVLPAITVGLQDLDDDVRAVAASSLIPVVEGLVQLLPNKVRGAVVMLFIHIHIVFMVKVLNSVCVCFTGTLHRQHAMGFSFGPGRPHCFHQQHHDIAVFVANLPASPRVQVSLRDVSFDDTEQM